MNSGDLRRVWPLSDMPTELHGPDLARMAHHEAGHVVLMEWCGFEVSGASAEPHKGLATMAAMPDEPAPPVDYDKAFAAGQLAAMYHAGIVAELLYRKLPWRGITARMGSRDWLCASFVLSPHFGLGLAGHGFAQRTAWGVLSREWSRVEAIAARLIESGDWTPET